jgi:HK97 family phage major capsid protein
MELEVRSVMDEVAELRRVVEAGLTPSAPAAIASEIRSQAEFAKALLKGDEDAKALARAASDSGDAALLPAFIGYVDTLINNNRPTVSAFSRTPLPTSGLTVEYAQIDSNTLAVGQQDPENEALSFGNLTFETITAPVKTYGGYTSFSRQYVERANINTLNEVFRGLSLAYANTTNTSLVTYLDGLTWTGKVFDADGGTPSSLAEGIANATAYIYVHSGLRPEFILTGTDGYVKLAKVAATDGRLALSANGDGSNTVGAVNIPGLSGQVFGLPIIVDPAIGTGVVYLANSSAIATHESAGAPVRLTDGDITHLTDSVSVYGYMAITAPRLGAIVKLDVTA